MPFEDIKGLYDNSDYKLATVHGSAFVQMFQTGDDFNQKIYRERLLLVSSVQEGLQKTLQGDVAFLWGHSAVYDLVGQACTHAQVEKIYYSAPMGWVIKKDFEYAGFINH